MIKTPMTADRVADPESCGRRKRIFPLGRAGRPEEVAELPVYLAAAYVTGQSFTIDGGLQMNLGRGA